MRGLIHVSLFTTFIVVVGCGDTSSDTGGLGKGGAADSGTEDGGLNTDGGLTTCEQPPDAPINPAPHPEPVPAGTACTSDQDCEGVNGFCRPLEAGGAECAAFSDVGETCGGLPKPSERTECLPRFECDAPDVVTPGECICIPDCSADNGGTKECGSDGCGGSCGDCGDDQCLAQEICHEFAGDQCCNPIVVQSLPFEHKGFTFGAEDSIPVPGVQPKPDKIISFTPSEAGDYYVWGSCSSYAISTECSSNADPIFSHNCEILEDPLGFEEDYYTSLPMEAGQEYSFTEESYEIHTQPAPDDFFIRRIYGPVRTVVTDSGLSIDDIAVDNTHVYWIKGNELFRHAKDGTGAATLIMIGPDGDLSDLVLAGDSVYTLSKDNGLILKVAKTGGAPTGLAVGEITAESDLAASDQYLYWTQAEPQGNSCDPPPDPTSVIRRMTLAGGTAEDFVTMERGELTLTTNGNYLYWISRVGTNVTCSFKGGAKRRLHTGGAIESFITDRNLERITIAGDNIYIAHLLRFSPRPRYGWTRIKKSTLEVVHQYASEGGYLEGGEIVSDGTFLYRADVSFDQFSEGPAPAGSLMAIGENDFNDQGMALLPHTYHSQVAFDGSELYASFDGNIVALPRVQPSL